MKDAQKKIVHTELGRQKNSEKSPCTFSFLRSKFFFEISPRGNPEIHKFINYLLIYY